LQPKSQNVSLQRTTQGIAGGDFDSRYSQRGSIKQASKAAGITKEVCVHTLRHTFATHLLEDGLDTHKNLLGHENIETTMDYLHIATRHHKSL
jgi:site-specific recombinase XerD